LKAKYTGGTIAAGSQKKGDSKAFKPLLSHIDKALPGLQHCANYGTDTKRLRAMSQFSSSKGVARRL